MTALKSLWASVQGDPILMRRVNGWLTLFWIAMIPVSMIMGWLSSVVYVSALSLWALVSGHWSAWQAARVEVNQQRAEQEAAETDLPGDVADEVIARTGLADASSLDDRSSGSLVAGTAERAPMVVAEARDLLMGRCHVDEGQAISYLQIAAALSKRSLECAAEDVLRGPRAMPNRQIPPA
ncbi:ANTAR domain-containing protein [Nakamurella panacisegetis]|uniref:ANTAR domain-containing protein n=1 Tax=Nakamurella panacisegetis TaxID=1090615 RepID=A0A1H0RFY9_9ACTN|nr:hypothetical protein [Nakamurella panacisegetis]SDP27936.1 ANTAR domain-containing protein [Nakamurella panacisegetis]